MAPPEPPGLPARPAEPEPPEPRDLAQPDGLAAAADAAGPADRAEPEELTETERPAEFRPAELEAAPWPAAMPEPEELTETEQPAAQDEAMPPALSALFAMSAPAEPAAAERSAAPGPALLDEPAPAPATGHDAPPARSAPSATPAGWNVVVSSDRNYYDATSFKRALFGPNIEFPAYSNERRLPLAGNQMRIGRRSAALGLEPEIDLAGPPTDPGVSRLHAVLIAAPDGTWAVLDPGSANGTLVNGHEIAIGDLVTLRDGDRINLGAWTAITVHRG